MKTIWLKLSLFILSFSILLILPFSAKAQVWTNLGLYGGQIYDISIDPTNPAKVFAGSYLGDGLFRTLDGGNKWQPVLMEEEIKGEDTFKNQAVWAVKIAKSNSRIVWAAHNYWVARSTDGGETWTHVENSTMQRGCTGCGGEGDDLRYCTALAIDSRDPQTVYVGTRGPQDTYFPGAVYRSRDGGLTWTKMNQGADFDYAVTDITIDPQNSATVWVTTSNFGLEEGWAGRLHRSGDGGETWTTVFSGRAGMTSVVVKPNDSNTVFTGSGYGIIKHFFDGTQWRLLWPVIPEEVGCRAVTDVVFDPQDPNVLYAAWKNPQFGDLLPKISRSIDGGTAWETYVVDYYFITLAIDPMTPQTVYGGEIGQGVFKSLDHGQTWSPINNGITAVITYDVAVDSKDSTHILAGTMSGLYEKRQGSAWSKLLEYDTGSVKFDPLDSRTIYAGLWGYVAKTTDGGQSWTYSLYSDGTGKVTDIDVDPVAAGTFYIAVGSFTGAGGAIFKTSDGGDSFANVLIGQNRSGEPYDLNAVRIDPSDSRHVFAGGGNFYAPMVNGDLWESADGGTTWSRNSLSLHEVIVNDLLIDPSDPRILYAGCGYSGGVDVPVYKSVDGGVTWKESFNGIVGNGWNAVTDLTFHRQNKSIVYASTLQAGVYISPNRAENWLSLELPEYAVFAVSAGSLYAATESGLWQCTGAGIIAGQLIDDVTKAGVHLATIFNDLGVKTLSVNGQYMMVSPVGEFSLTAVKDGYANKTVEDVAVYGGDVTWVDMSMGTGISDPRVTSVGTGGKIGGGGCFISTVIDGPR